VRHKKAADIIKKAEKGISQAVESAALAEILLPAEAGYGWLSLSLSLALLFARLEHEV